MKDFSTSQAKERRLQPGIFGVLLVCLHSAARKGSMDKGELLSDEDSCDGRWVAVISFLEIRRSGQSAFYPPDYLFHQMMLNAIALRFYPMQMPLTVCVLESVHAWWWFLFHRQIAMKLPTALTKAVTASSTLIICVVIFRPRKGLCSALASRRELWFMNQTYHLRTLPRYRKFVTGIKSKHQVIKHCCVVAYLFCYEGLRT